MTTTTTHERRLGGRVRTAWRAAHDPVEGVPRWARIAAYAIPWVVLPSSIWRVATFTFHIPLVDASSGDRPVGEPSAWLPGELYVVLLSVVSELAAFAAIGLIARWGEVFPRWAPGLRGRRVPIGAAVVPAAFAAVVLTVLWAWATVASMFRRTIQWDPAPPNGPFAEYDWQFAIAAIAYVPLVAWGPLLAAVTVAYYRRRRADGRVPSDEGSGSRR